MRWVDYYWHFKQITESTSEYSGRITGMLVGDKPRYLPFTASRLPRFPVQLDTVTATRSSLIIPYAGGLDGGSRETALVGYKVQ